MSDSNLVYFSTLHHALIRQMKVTKAMAVAMAVNREDMVVAEEVDMTEVDMEEEGEGVDTAEGGMAEEATAVIAEEDMAAAEVADMVEEEEDMAAIEVEATVAEEVEEVTAVATVAVLRRTPWASTVTSVPILESSRSYSIPKKCKQRESISTSMMISLSMFPKAALSHTTSSPRKLSERRC